MRLGQVLGTSDEDAGFLRADTPRRFQFPADHAAHPGYRTEWWYLTATLTGADGREFGLQFTVFRQAVAASVTRSTNPWQVRDVYMAHFALSDVAASRHVPAERLSRGHDALAGVRQEKDGHTVALEGWSLHLGAQDWQLTAATEAFAVELEITPTRGMVLQGDAGLSWKSAGQASYYYSAPRLEVAGDVRLDDQTYRVRGEGWFDHEWSTSVLSDEQIGWDWFALHLDDGRDLMAFRLRRKDGLRDPHDHGALVQGRDQYRLLRADQFELTPDAYWQDERGVAWPTAWTVQVAAEDFYRNQLRDLSGVRTWRVVAAFDDQRMRTLVPYWEGLVHVYDASAQKIGRGYMELTGYGG